MDYTQVQIWALIVMIGLGTFALRFSFLGLVGRRKLPDWALQHLRYTPVAVIPGLMAPQIFFPPANGGETDPGRLLAASVTLAVGLYVKNPIWAILAGAGTLTLWMAMVG